MDGTDEPDSYSNGSNGEEAFDGATYPGSYVADVISTCVLEDSWGSEIIKLDGIDQFIYCAERTADAKNVDPYNSFRNYSFKSEAATEPSSWSQSMIRQLWKYNLYNIAP